MSYTNTAMEVKLCAHISTHQGQSVESRPTIQAHTRTATTNAINAKAAAVAQVAATTKRQNAVIIKLNDSMSKISRTKLIRK